MKTETTTTDPGALVEYPSFSGTLTRAQARTLANDCHAFRLAAGQDKTTTRERFDAARKAVRAMIRAGRLQARIMEAENDAKSFNADGSEGLALRSLRARGDKADKAARDLLRPFGHRLTYPGPYPLAEPVDGRGPQIFPEY